MSSYLIYNRAKFLCTFHFLMWLFLQMPQPIIWPFIFRVLDWHYQLVDPSEVLCIRLIMLCKNSGSCHDAVWNDFWLSSKVVALHLGNCIAKAYLCNQDGTVSPFHSRLACKILRLTDKHSIIFIPSYIPSHLNVEADFLSWGQLLLEWHLLPCIAQGAFLLWSLSEVDLLTLLYTTQCQL